MNYILFDTDLVNINATIISRNEYSITISNIKELVKYYVNDKVETKGTIERTS